MKRIRVDLPKTYYVSVYYYDGDRDTYVDVLDEIIQLDEDDYDLKTISDIESVYRYHFPYDNIEIKDITWCADGIEFKKDLNLKL